MAEEATATATETPPETELTPAEAAVAKAAGKEPAPTTPKTPVTETETTKPDETSSEKAESLMGQKPDAESEKAALDPYETFTTPEEFPIDEKLVEKALPLMRRHEFTQEDGQEFVDLVTDMRKAELEQMTVDAQEQSASWKKEILADPDFGKDEEVYAQSIDEADRALEKYGDATTRKAMDDLGISNHPGLFRLLVRMGRAIGPGKIITPDSAAGGPKEEKDLPSKLLPDHEANVAKRAKAVSG